MGILHSFDITINAPFTTKTFAQCIYRMDELHCSFYGYDYKTEIFDERLWLTTQELIDHIRRHEHDDALFFGIKLYNSLFAVNCFKEPNNTTTLSFPLLNIGKWKNCYSYQNSYDNVDFHRFIRVLMSIVSDFTIISFDTSTMY